MKKSSKNNNQVTTEANTSMLSQERKMELMPAGKPAFIQRSQQMTIHQVPTKAIQAAYMMALGTKLANLYVKMLRMRKIMLILLVALG